MKHSQDPCHVSDDLLVDYVDGDLHRERQDELHAHLQVCNECQRRVHDFEESLVVARAVWRQRVGAVNLETVGRRRASRSIRAAVASAVIFATGVLAFQSMRKPDSIAIAPKSTGESVTRPNQDQGSTTPSPTPDTKASIETIEALMIQAEREARLRSAIDMLREAKVSDALVADAEAYVDACLSEGTLGADPVDRVDLENEG